MDIAELPVELQKKILDHLSEKDRESAYKVSLAWQEMIQSYQIKFSSINKTDWRWFCKHKPMEERCKSCHAQINRKYKSRQSSDWDWWLDQAE